MKIYTRTGDKGKTSLFGGKRVSKAALRVEAYGTVDELNSAIGAAIAEMQKSSVRQAQDKNQKHRVKIKNDLERIQHDLFEIGAMLANPSGRNYSSSEQRESRSGSRRVYTERSERARTITRVDEFEQFIDEMTVQLPELRNFILPGGGRVGSLLHLCRAVSRRAERRIVALSKKESIQNDILIYFNRLSDLLFTMARFINYKEKQKEIIWTKK